jgi:hypothetical protein
MIRGDLMESKSNRNHERTLYASKKNGTNAARALKPRIGGEWPLKGVGEALTRLTSGNTTRKLLLRV